MFEIGSSLREARRRRGLDLSDVEGATRIRTRYLDAIEHERFELLPPGVYRRSFLRGYADFLDLDGEAYVAEYEARFETSPPEPPPPPPRRRRTALPAAGALRAEVLAVGAGVAILIAFAAWKLGGSSNAPAHTAARAPAPTTTAPRRTTAPARHPRAVLRPPSATPAVLVLSAARGDCWLSVRAGTAAGPVVYEGTLLDGHALRFGLRRPLWIRLGAPWNLDAAIGGRSATGQLPARTGDVVVSRGGLEPAR